MLGLPATTAGRRPLRYLAGALVASVFALTLLSGCGISLSSGATETELFKRLTIDGDFRAGGALTLTLEYAQPYPVTVDVACELLITDFKGTATPRPTPGTPTPPSIPIEEPTPASKVLDILGQALPSNDQGGPAGEVTPVTGTITRAFQAPAQPGRYTVRCLTPRDENNRIAKRITIAPAGE